MPVFSYQIHQHILDHEIIKLYLILTSHYTPKVTIFFLVISQLELSMNVIYNHEETTRIIKSLHQLRHVFEAADRHGCI